MLPKNQRLNLKTDFKWVSSGKKIDTKYAKLFIKMGDPSTGSTSSLQASSGPRIGIAVSGKSFKKSTQRNRAKRLVSAAFESLYSILPPSVNIVALPKAGILDVKSDDLLKDLESKLKDEKLISR